MTDISRQGEGAGGETAASGAASPAQAGAAGLLGRLGDYWARSAPRRQALRRRTSEVLEGGRGEDLLSTVVEYFLVFLIVANIIAFVIDTVPAIEHEWGPWLWAFEVFSVIVFTIEYAARIWSSVEISFLRSLPPWRARLRYASWPSLVIDLLAILPFYLGIIASIDLRFIRVFRLLRFLKLARYSPALHTLVRVLANERRALMAALLLVMAALLFAASGMYFLERHVQPEHFGSIPEAAWWAIVTLTTVGYGDVAPVTAAGRVFAGLVMLSGLIVLALPIAIIATGFSQEVGRRDFVLTWSMLSKIPLFSALEAQSVGEIMRYLHAHNYPPQWEILPRGTSVDGVYFIASGRVRATSPEDDVDLGTGEFFGEFEMLDHRVTERTYVAASRVRLLKLGRDDFQRLQMSYPEIGNQIRAVAEHRRLKHHVR